MTDANPSSKQRSVCRWSGPDANNVITEWVTLRASDYEQMRPAVETASLQICPTCGSSRNARLTIERLREVLWALSEQRPVDEIANLLKQAAAQLAVETPKYRKWPGEPPHCMSCDCGMTEEQKRVVPEADYLRIHRELVDLKYPETAKPVTETARPVVKTTVKYHKLDNARQVLFYEQEFYVLSNFSAFTVEWADRMFPTSEHAYHWAKFPSDPLKQRAIQVASSAHAALKMAERWKRYRREDWDDVKVGIMHLILLAKVEQHQYVRNKLLQTGDRELIEDSWRDDFWGWGPKRDGRNMLGKLWMEIREGLSS